MKRKQRGNEDAPLLHDLQEQLSEIKLRIALLEAAAMEEEATQAYYDALPADAEERRAEQAFHDRWI